MAEALDDGCFGTVTDGSVSIPFGGSPFGHPPYDGMEGYAGLSEVSGAGRNVFLHGEPVGAAAGDPGAAGDWIFEPPTRTANP